MGVPLPACVKFKTTSLTAGHVEVSTGARGVPDVIRFEMAPWPVPFAFRATTVKVYAVPFVRPVTVKGDPEPVVENPPGDAVTV